MMVGSSGGMIIVNSGKWPCGFCGNGVQANSVQCTVCKKWIHKRCSGVRGDLSRVADVSGVDNVMGQSRASTLEMKGRVYASCVRSSMTYGSETRLVGVEPITTFIRSGRLK